MKLQRASINADDSAMPTRKAPTLYKRWKPFIFLAVVVAMLIVSMVALWISEVSKLIITVSNNSDEELVVRVWVDEFEGESALMEPQETITLEWDITGKISHRYYVLHHEPGMLVSVYFGWIYINVYPFTSESLTIDIT